LLSYTHASRQYKTAYPMGDVPKENQNQTPSKSDDYDGWGFDLFPERRGTFRPSVKNVLFQGRGNENVERIKCESKVNYCINKSGYNALFDVSLESH